MSKHIYVRICALAAILLGMLACGNWNREGNTTRRPISYSVTATAGPGTSVTPATRTVTAGATTTFECTLLPGYSNLTVTGGNGTLNGPTYTTGPINADTAITLSATPDPIQYTVTANAGPGTSVTPTTRTVTAGATTTFECTLLPGYSNLTVTGGNGTLNGPTYTTGPINANTAITLSATPDPVQYTVTASVGAGTFVTPTTRTVTAGATTTFECTLLPGYSNLAVTGGNGTLNGTTFTTGPINADTIITTSATLDDPTVYFSEDFESGTTDNWDLTPNADGAFTVESTTDYQGATTKALKYTAGSTASNAVIALLKNSVWTAKVGSKTDYYVEARIRPLANGILGNKQLYMVARYTDGSNWLLGGLNVQSISSNSYVETGNMTSGTLTRAVRVLRTIGSDTAWYKVRLEVSASTQTIYMDGEELGTTTIPTAITGGRIGLFTNNKSFYIDDIKVGDPSVKPVLLSISPNDATYVAEGGDSDRTITVTASKNDGTSDDFTVVSDDPSVVSVTKGMTSGTATPVLLKPIAAGATDIRFTSNSDPALVRTIAASISPQYVDSPATYALTSSQVYPAPAATTAYPDDKLTLTFDSTPTLGTAGTIRIFKASDDSQVDRIYLSHESDTLGLNGSYRRGVATSPIRIDGNTVTITPHSGKLAYGTAYYVGISSTAFTGANLNGHPFDGIGKPAGWTFTTRSTQPDPAATTLTVGPANDTTADYHSVQGALNHVMANPSVSTPTIHISNGIYNELLFLCNRPNVTIEGESRAGVIIHYNNYETLNSGSGVSATGTPLSGGGRSVFMVENCDLLTLNKLTLKSTHLRSSVYSNQAEVLYFKSTTSTQSSGHRLIANNANFYSEQDTLQLQGYTWFYNTKVSGNIDFIWGNNYASLFEDSTIEILGDSQYPASISEYANGTGGYLVQARTYPGGKGFVFLNCNLTYADGPSGVHVATGANASSYLARAASGTWVDNVAYIDCRMDSHIAALGWASGVVGNPAPNPATPTSSAGWREYGSMDPSGTLLSMSGRSTNSKQLTADEVTNNGLDNRRNVFSAISWSPIP